MKKDKSGSVIISFALETAPASRIYFLKKFLKPGNDQGVYQAQTGKYIRKKFRAWHFVQLSKWFFTWELAWFLSIFKKKKYHAGWTLDSIDAGVQAILLSRNSCSFYFFISLSSINYILNYFVSEILNEKCSMISSNSPMYRPMRYTFLPSGSLKLCSSFMQDEYNAYVAMGWMKFKDAEVWGLEEADQLDRVQDFKAEYDIAVYSSAEWARNKFYWREKDMERVRNYSNTTQFIYRTFDETVLDTVIRLKQEYGLKVILYPHPYERLLMEKQEIFPPYLEKIKNAGIIFDSSGKNSVASIYKAKLAVAECSTIIMDRWHLTLPGYTYSGLGHEKEFQVDYKYQFLGRYKRYCYSDAADLKDKLETEINLFKSK